MSFKVRNISKLKMLVEETRRALQGLVKIAYGPTPPERSSMTFRHSLYIAQDIRKGETLNSENIRALRAGFGLLPKYLDFIIAKKGV